MGGGVYMAGLTGTGAPRRRRVKADPAPTTPDPIEIAMEADAKDVSPDSPARRVLLKHEQLISWQIASERAGFALKVLTAMTGVAVALILALMAWQASRADGLVVEAFLVPQDISASGATGEVVARQVLDRLGQIDAEANSLEAVEISDAWTKGVSIQVPATGVSLDDVRRLLRTWLGHETHITGEVIRTAGVVQLKVRSGVGRTVVANGSADQLPALADQAAEQIFAAARPTVYAEVLYRRGALDAASRVLDRIIASSRDRREIGAARYLQGMIAIRSDASEAVLRFRQAAQSPDPTRAAMGHAMANNALRALGHAAEARAEMEAATRLIGRSRSPNRPQRLANYSAVVLASRQDFAAAERTIRPIVGQEYAGSFRNPDEPKGARFRGSYARYIAAQHRLGEARRSVAGAPPREVLFVLEDWPAVVREAELDPLPDLRADRQSWAQLAISFARVGRLEDAERLALTLPRDCASCLRARAHVASLKGDRTGAERWFAAAVAMDPYDAVTLVDWGRERLAWGQADAAIAAFRQGAEVSPRFADPLSWWGEALLEKGDAKGAAVKFAEAAKLAPRWGRLHLKWGEALAKLGKADEARAKWRAAATMDLSLADRADLLEVSRKQTR